MWDVTDDVTADVYAKYFWGHLWGDDGTICGQKFEFDDIYSSRVRTRDVPRSTWRPLFCRCIRLYTHCYRQHGV